MIFYSEEKGHHSHMVRIVLAEKDIACEIKEFNPEGKLPEELPTINPYNKLPVLVDREVTIYEPRVILEYLESHVLMNWQYIYIVALQNPSSINRIMPFGKLPSGQL